MARAMMIPIFVLLHLLFLNLDGCFGALADLHLIPLQHNQETIFSRFLEYDVTRVTSKGIVTSAEKHHFMIRDVKRINIQSAANLILSRTAIQSNSGSNLGLNVSMSGDIISLSFGGQAIYSFYGNYGSQFYVPQNSLYYYSFAALDPPTTVVSSEMVCFSLKSQIKCYVLGQYVWNDVALYSPCSKVQCTAGNPMSLWRSAIAYSGTTPTGRRYVQVSAAKSSQGSYSMSCLGGCGYSTDVMTSSDPTFGTSVALSENFLAIGCPGNNYVRVLKASGADLSADPYSPFTGWTLFNTFYGNPDQNFGQQMSISSNFLIVGAPATSCTSGMVAVYRVDGSTNVSKFCEITDSNIGSLFGFSIAQISYGNLTFAVIGAPGENMAYVLALRHSPYLCEVRNSLAPVSGTVFPGDQFGYSVAINRQSIFVGVPYYSTPDISGLLYVFTYCSPGYVAASSSSCTPCSTGQTSDGGVSRCVPCNVSIPQHASCSPGCSPSCECNAGYFGDRCLPCSQYALSAGHTKPLNSSWIDQQATCTWKCDMGFQKTNDTCLACPNTDQFDRLLHVEWIPGTCSWRCKATYFRVNQSGIETNCTLCSQYKAALGQQPPANAEWLDRFNECKYVPLPGYSCQSDQNCLACNVSKPNNSHWLTVNDRYSSPSQSVTITSLCEFACDQTFFIAPTSPPTCVPCDVYMSNFSDATLPAHGLWQASTAVCTSDSWMCTAGYSRSNTSRYCCPNAVNHSVVNQSYAPCGVSCEYGYRWSNELASCLQCNTNMTEGTFRWLLDCDFECFCNDTVCYHGKETLGACYTCQEYSQKVGWVPPLYGEYPVYSKTCRVDDWQCKNDTFSKSLVATPPGCCLKSTPNAVANLSSPATCNLDCEPGYRWDPTRKQCFYCGIPFPRSAHMLWSSLTCKWICEPAFMQVFNSSSIQSEEFQCLNCPTYAAFNSWQLPSLAYWVNSTTLEQQGAICSTNAWQCADGYLKNAPAKLCCQNLSFPFNAGKFSTTSCDWICNVGLFPKNRIGETSTCSLCSCTCEQYLASFGIESPCQTCSAAFSKASGWCSSVGFSSAPSACTVSIKGFFMIKGISLQSFFAASVVKSTLAALGAIINPKIVPVVASATQAAQTRRSTADSVSLSVIYQNVDPTISSFLLSQIDNYASRAIESALSSNGYSVQVTLAQQPTRFISGASVSCSVGYTYNPETGICCPSSKFRSPPNGSYVWSTDGCTWSCQPYYFGDKCVTCEQSRAGSYKPQYAYWDNNSPTCDQWKCIQGYVVSQTGTTCLSLADMTAKCSGYFNCAGCTNDAHCVWCSDKCVPGQGNLAGKGCTYNDTTISTNCTCEKVTCTYECKHTSCGSCVNDNFCGWCSSSSQCMPGDYFSPNAGLGACPVGWSVGAFANCPQNNNIWLVGIICAAISTFLIVILCIHFILRIRAASNRRPRLMFFQYGDQSGGLVAREQVQRFLDTFPTFKFDENKLPPSFSASRSSEAEGQTEGQTDGQDEEDNRPTCSICLGNFFTGEDCRMLPCLHVFHKNCIDQWLSMSQECPLCKRSVISMASEGVGAVVSNL
uniref:RING-type domain-containing protein n=2 Tax=Guillardia theta TaxID=55529 RepID=A0A7S4U9B9_GUITH|mmetsp:Transcript_43335/g.137012  ORF Transcript_43335/g.137012 Transcript_43335/m.137012 type:complete len:1564 (+) Transcript_43335:41-4732(+)